MDGCLSPRSRRVDTKALSWEASLGFRLRDMVVDPAARVYRVKTLPVLSGMGFIGESHGEIEGVQAHSGVNLHGEIWETANQKLCECAQLKVSRHEKTTSRVAWKGGNGDRMVLLWAALIESIRALQGLKQLHFQTGIFS